MFDDTIAHWMTFIVAAVLLNLSPGPDIAYILSQTVKNGQRAGFYAMFGIWLGALVHVLLATFGLSAILATSATAFTIIKWIGAIYLIWLGIQALRSPTLDFSVEKQKNSANKQPGILQILTQGTLVATLNPKVALFFLAFLPQFVLEGAGPVSLQLLLHGTLIIVVAAIIEPPLVVLGGKMSGFINQHPRVSAWLDRTLGSLIIALGIKLALTERN